MVRFLISNLLTNNEVMAKKLSISSMEKKIILEPVPKDSHIIRCKVLIVCEGEKTEPNYFKSFSMMKNSSGMVYEVSTGGGGINTTQVVDKAIELRDKAIKAGDPYDSVWAVFDKDDFNPSMFDNAINKADAQGISCAWSNEAFELWYVYHFDDRCTPMNRSTYKKTITSRVRSAGFKKYTYKKNDPNMRQVLSNCMCDEAVAIKRASRQASTYLNRKFSTHNPCTVVYRLISLLNGNDEDFNKRIRKELSRK